MHRAVEVGLSAATAFGAMHRAVEVGPSTAAAMHRAVEVGPRTITSGRAPFIYGAVRVAAEGLGVRALSPVRARGVPTGRGSRGGPVARKRLRRMATRGIHLDMGRRAVQGRARAHSVLAFNPSQIKPSRAEPSQIKSSRVKSSLDGAGAVLANLLASTVPCMTT